jgi:hypothetical protein
MGGEGLTDSMELGWSLVWLCGATACEEGYAQYNVAWTPFHCSAAVGAGSVLTRSTASDS